MAGKSKKVIRKRAMHLRKKRRAGPSSVVIRGPKGTVFPDRYFVKLRYSLVATATGTAPFYQQAMNGMADVIPPVGNQRPMGFAELSDTYKKYRVYKSSIKTKFINLAGPATVVVVPLPNQTTTITGVLERTLEQRYSKNKILTGVSAGGTCTLSHSMKINKFFGVKDVSEEQFEGTTTSHPLGALNPAETGYWNVGIYSADGVTPVSIPLSSEVTFWCEFFEPVMMNIS